MLARTSIYVAEPLLFLGDYASQEMHNGKVRCCRDHEINSVQRFIAALCWSPLCAGKWWAVRQVNLVNIVGKLDGK